MREIFRIAVGLVAWLASSTFSFASVAECTNKASWQASAGQFSTITFTELPANTLIVNQYSGLGVHFTDGSDFIDDTPNVYSDGVGLNGAFDSTMLVFDVPMTSIAIDFPGSAQIMLFSNRQLIYTSSLFIAPFPTSTGGFAGLISSQPFDSAQLVDPLGGLFADNLHFGPPIPAPGALGLISIMWLATSRRRRVA